MMFVKSVSSVNVGILIKKLLEEYVTLEPDTELVKSYALSVIFIGVPKPIVIKCTGLIFFCR